jgi:hypothetical protein
MHLGDSSNGNIKIKGRRTRRIRKGGKIRRSRRRSRRKRRRRKNFIRKFFFKCIAH